MTAPPSSSFRTPIRRLLLIGIGAGDPSFVTVQAAGAIAEVDAFLVIDKGEAKADLASVRRQVLDRFTGSKPFRILTLEDTVRSTDVPYEDAVAQWHLERVAAFERTMLADVDEDETAGILVWGDPSLYDSTLRIVDQVNAAGRLSLDGDASPFEM